MMYDLEKSQAIIMLRDEIKERQSEDIKKYMKDGSFNLALYKTFSDDTNRYYRYKMREIIGNIPQSLITALSIGETPM